MTILFCNIGWMQKYNGIKGDSIKHGGSYNENETGHEVCNFSDEPGYVYGHVREAGRMTIERLGASEDDESIPDITVIWTARPENGGTVVVGWYENATVYREYQTLPKRTKLQKDNGLERYRIEASANDATLLPSDERTFPIPRGVKGFMGRRNIWYADSPESKKLVTKVRKLVRERVS